MIRCLLTLWLRIAERIVGWTLGNDPERDYDDVNITSTAL